MAGLIFAISILTILTTVGFLFAWMVRLASCPQQQDMENKKEKRSHAQDAEFPTQEPPH